MRGGADGGASPGRATRGDHQGWHGRGDGPWQGQHAQSAARGRRALRPETCAPPACTPAGTLPHPAAKTPRRAGAALRERPLRPCSKALPAPPSNPNGFDDLHASGWACDGGCLPQALPAAVQLQQGVGKAGRAGGVKRRCLAGRSVHMSCEGMQEAAGRPGACCRLLVGLPASVLCCHAAGREAKESDCDLPPPSKPLGRHRGGAEWGWGGVGLGGEVLLSGVG